MHPPTRHIEQQNQQTMTTQFPVDGDAIVKRLEQIDPEAYARTRNYTNGAVTYLSPYMSRGVLSTIEVFDHLKEKKHSWHQVE